MGACFLARLCNLGDSQGLHDERSAAISSPKMESKESTEQSQSIDLAGTELQGTPTQVDHLSRISSGPDRSSSDLFL